MPKSIQEYNKVRKPWHEKDRNFWRSSYNREVFSRMIDGETLDEIIDSMKTTKCKIARVVSDSSFLRRLQDYFVSYSLNKEILRYKYTQKLAREAMNRIPKMDDQAIVKEFGRMLRSDPPETNAPRIVGMILDFFKDQMNIGSKRKDEEEFNPKEEFGYEEANFDIANEKDSDNGVDQEEPPEDE